MSVPIDTPTLSPFPILPLARSLGGNEIGAEGATALAAVLKETKITNLKCAAAPKVFAFVSAPIDTPTLSPSPILPLARSLRGNQIGAQGATALAAILNETKITNLKCAAAPKVFAFVSAPLDTTALSITVPTSPMLCSLRNNDIGHQAKQAVIAAAGSGLKVQF